MVYLCFASILKLFHLHLYNLSTKKIKASVLTMKQMTCVGISTENPALVSNKNLKVNVNAYNLGYK